MDKRNLKKENIIENLSLKTGYSKNFSKKLVNDLIEILIDNIKLGNLNLKNIGVFRLIKKKQRIGRNPLTGEIFVISARKSLSFVASNKISKYLEKII